MSSTTLEFWRYVLEHKHELEAILTSVSAEGANGIRGRVNAVRTQIRRRLTANGALFAYDAPQRSYDVGPNQLVAWILRKAQTVMQSFLVGDGSPYECMARESLRLLRDAQRLEAIKMLASTTMLETSRPPTSAVKQAARSRRTLYRRAYDAYALLTAIENGEESAIASVLSETLIAPLNDWQSFELMTALSIGLALERISDTPMRISNLTLGSSAPIIRVGTTAIYWQRHGPDYEAPSYGFYERKLNRILEAYNAPFAADRPDLTIVDEARGESIAIVEVKYFEAESSARDALRAAIEQLVRYARGYASRTPIDDMLGRSLVALMSRSEIQPAAVLPPGVPSLVDFADLLEDRLDSWLTVILFGRIEPPCAGSGSAS